jgi:ABC-2 type transport system permease protein
MKLRPVWTVARWEYKRFAKPRDLLLSVVFFVVIFGVYGFVTGFMERRNAETRTVAVFGAERMALQDIDALGRFPLQQDERPLKELDLALEDEEFDALLVIADRTTAALRVRSESGWQQEFMALLNAHRQAARPAEANLDPAVIETLTEPLLVSLDVKSNDEGGRAGTWTVLIIVGSMLMGLFTGFSYVFIAITSEKTQKVTESVLSAITPQQWMDGKILGLTLVVLVNVLSYALGYVIYKAIDILVLHATFEPPQGIGDPLAVLWLLLFAFFGFGFWFTFFAVVAATISDPNTSSRSSLLFLPFLPLSLALAGMDNPDGLWMRALSLIPGLSPTAMPVRLLRGDPGFLEVLGSLLLLVAMVVVLRRLAGRVFGISMLMTGKEPSWREVARWMRQA